MKSIGHIQSVVAALVLGCIGVTQLSAAHAIPESYLSLPPETQAELREQAVEKSHEEKLQAGIERYQRRQAQRQAYVNNLSENARLAKREAMGVLRPPDSAPSTTPEKPIWMTVCATLIPLMIATHFLFRRRQERNQHAF